MRKLYLVTLIIISTIFIGFMDIDNSNNINGIVRDVDTNEPLVGVKISIGDDIVFTDFDGRFDTKIRKGDYNLSTSYISYSDELIPIKIYGDTTMEIKLQN